MTGDGVEWDQVVVGAGSAGAVVASRLSADGRQRVLLLEAGPDQPAGPSEPNPLSDGTRLFLDGFNWDYLANLRTRTGEPDGTNCGHRVGASPRLARVALAGRPRALWERFPYRLGKVVGGSSAVNGAVAMRALPQDFADWVALGNPAWSWADVLPFYRKIESDADFPGGEHGDRGPVPVGRPRPDQLHELDRLFWAECIALGLPDQPDLNAGQEIGVGPVPANTVARQRMDTAATYLASARRRPNLTLRTGTRVTRLVIDGRRVAGVEAVRDGRASVIPARRVVLCAGAVGSPVILQRSGIGPADRSRALGVVPVADLPGVGENLADHPSVVIWSRPREGLCRPGIPWRQVAARLSSGVGGVDGAQAGRADLQVWLLNNVETATIPGFANRLCWPMVVGISVMLLRPAARGRVFLDDPGPDATPVIELGFGSVPDDVERLAAGVRTAWRILRSPAFSARLVEIQSWRDGMVADESVLRGVVRNVMSPGWHAVGSARMGPAGDPMSVVDQECRVYGIENLRVVDASVFPTMPSAPTNLTTIMLAERIASWMRG